MIYYRTQDLDIDNVIRVTFYVPGFRPILILIDKRYDDIEAVMCKICQKLCIFYKSDYCMIHPSGAIVEDLELLVNNDRIMLGTFYDFPCLQRLPCPKKDCYKPKSRRMTMDELLGITNSSKVAAYF
ncbi:unnamed protein product [Moneuplotes crassus]|uniref:Uncharacterized protein n=1 Tax=Euplotes crassus TaxID=5936 RepID=A0AAD1XWB4_EUPCR|nr:unnamed protein product [Moneuplotes crassus]